MKDTVKNGILYTVGHGTLQADTFANTLRAAGVTVAADVRRFPGSRRNPQFGDVEMARWLDAAGIAYRPFLDLGGRRTPVPGSPNTGLRNTAFRAYADYMATPEFARAFAALIALAREQPVAMFCAETLWWKCHRRLLADAAVLLAGFDVRHLTPSARSSHVLTPGVHVLDGALRYDDGAPTLGV
jgi:uncharacterized protein (DUF488 family)